MSPIEIADLSDADQQALDALVEAEYDLQRVPHAHRERAQRLLTLLAVLDQLPAPAPAPAASEDLLTQRTLQAINRSRQQARFSQQIEQLTAAPTPGGIGVRELVAVAAMVVVGVSLLFPMLSNARSIARQVACQSNLASTGAAFGAYALDYAGAMPATAWRSGDQWWHTGQFDEDYAQSNSAHLFVLPRSGYVSLTQMGCPENAGSLAHQGVDLDEHRDWPAHEALCYSYQNQFTSRPTRWDSGPIIAVLADKSPVFEPGRFVRERADAPSANHDGQNMLLNTGEVRWSYEPLLAGNRIYHAGDNGIDNYTGTEEPAHRGDTFLVP